MSLPKAIVNLDSALLNLSDAITSLIYTASLTSFGISIPTVPLPGIGASIRIALAARLSAISSARLTILLTLTPGAGSNS